MRSLCSHRMCLGALSWHWGRDVLDIPGNSFTQVLVSRLLPSYRSPWTHGSRDNIVVTKHCYHTLLSCIPSACDSRLNSLFIPSQSVMNLYWLWKSKKSRLKIKTKPQPPLIFYTEEFISTDYKKNKSSAFFYFGIYIYIKFENCKYAYNISSSYLPSILFPFIFLCLTTYLLSN